MMCSRIGSSLEVFHPSFSNEGIFASICASPTPTGFRPPTAPYQPQHQRPQAAAAGFGSSDHTKQGHAKKGAPGRNFLPNDSWPGQGLPRWLQGAVGSGLGRGLTAVKPLGVRGAPARGGSEPGAGPGDQAGVPGAPEGTREGDAPARPRPGARGRGSRASRGALGSRGAGGRGSRAPLTCPGSPRWAAGSRRRGPPRPEGASCRPPAPGPGPRRPRRPPPPPLACPWRAEPAAAAGKPPSGGERRPGRSSRAPLAAPICRPPGSGGRRH